MSAFIDLTGQKFNQLLILKFYGKDKRNNALWECLCDCGNKKIIPANHIKSGHTKSCGCLFKKGNAKTHGRSTTRTYKIWKQIKQRCYNKNNPDYKDYGGRGINVCSRWLKPNGIGFLNFLKDIGEIPKNKEIDRIDNDGNYCKTNCRQATRKEQTRNSRRNHLLKYNGKELCFAEWEEITGIPQTTIRNRIRRGWSIKRALTTPVRKRRKK